MATPSAMTIGDITVSVDSQGWPRWTRINIRSGANGSFCLDEEQAHDMLYAFQRICEHLDDSKKRDQIKGIML